MGVLLEILTKGSTDRSLTLRMADSGDGTPETGVTSATGGLDVWYRREGAVKVSLTESDLSALTDAHSDGGILHVSDGEYRVDFPDAAFATGANYVDVGWGATGMVGFGGRVKLIGADLENAVRLGLTALPNAAADAAGGLPISDAGGLDLDARLDAAISSRMATYTQPTGFLAATFPNGTVANTTNITAGTITTAENLTNAPTNGDLTATMKTSVQTAADAALVANNLDHLAKTATAAADMTTEVADNTILARILSNGDTSAFDPSTDGLQPIRDQGDAAWATATGFSTHSAADVWSVATRRLSDATNITSSGSAITLHTDAKVLLAGTTHTSAVIPTVSTLTGHTAQTGDGYAVVSSGAHGNAALKTLIDAKASQTSVDDVPTNAELATAIITGLTTALTEGYRGTNATGSVRDLLYELLANITEFAISGTTKTAKKLDGSTTAKTYTLNSSTAPTSITEAT